MPASVLFPSRRRRLLGASALAALGAVLPPAARAAAGWLPATLPQGLQRDLRSEITGQHYRIFVDVPATPAPGAGHPVLFALDGNATFPALSLMARTAARRSRETGRAAPLVVGIGYPSGEDFGGGRSRDYTPPSGKDTPAGEGGADRFLDFIERELRPLVASLAPLDPARQALFGHSYGGLCTLHALFTRPGMFQAYLASSPSIWYRERIVLAGAAGFEKRLAALPAPPALMLAAGELEQPGAAPPGARQAIAVQRRMVDEARELAARLQAQQRMGRVRFHLLAQENHGSAMFPAMARGLAFFLDQEAAQP